MNLPLLEIRLHDVLVGVISRMPDDKNYFVFDRQYSEDPNRPTLSLSFLDPEGNLEDEFRPTRVKVLPFFSNLLPEGPLRDYLAAHAGVHRDREFFLLKALGDDLPGAIRVQPGQYSEPTPVKTLLEKPVDISEEIPEDMLRFSLAGVQMKFSALESKKGLTIPAHGVGGDWIVKLPSVTYPHVPENEFAMMTLAKEAGIVVPEVRLIPVASIRKLPQDLPESFEEAQAFAIRRFDRDNAKRIHIEDMAQVFGVYPSEKYGKDSYTNIARLLDQFSQEEDVLEFIRRLVFSAAIGNADMHLKNWSLIYPDGRAPKLSPGYDFVSTLVYIPGDTNTALSLVGTKKMTDYSTELFIRLAEKAKLPRHLIVKTALETADRIRAAWTDLSDDLPLSVKAKERLTAHMKQVPLMSGK